MSDTSVLEHVQTTPVPVTSDGDHDRFAHYVNKKALGDYYLSGVKPTAICGKKWAPGHDPSRYPICPECKAIFGHMQPGDPDNPDYKP